MKIKKINLAASNLAKLRWKGTTPEQRVAHAMKMVKARKKKAKKKVA